MSQKTINFAVIGCGALARQMHIPNIAKSTKTVLHTCCDLSDEALEECKAVHGALHISKDWEATIANPEIEAICIATTEKLRLPLIECAIKHGKPVYVEKPLATTLEEVYKIQQVVNASGIPFCVGHNRRNSPAMIDAHRIFHNQMDNPQICDWRWDREGDDRPVRKDDGVAAFTCRINDDWYSWKSWVFDKTQAPHGPMLFEMTHFTDFNVQNLSMLYAKFLNPNFTVSAEFKCPDFAEVECPFFDVDNKNPYSRQLSFCRELVGFSV